MDTLISNLIEEVDDSRSQMFEILETIAFEQAKTEVEKKKSNKKQVKKKKAQVSASFREDPKKGSMRDSRNSNKDAVASMQVGRSKSISMSGHRTTEGFGMEFEEESKETGFELKSPSDSSSSRMDESMLDEEDDFEDAEEGNVAVSSDKQTKTLKDVIILDCDEERIALPCLRDSKIKASTIWTILKDMVGKDITKYSMPVIVNEPMSIL